MSARQVGVLLCLVGLLGAPCAHAFTWEPCDADKVPFTPDNVKLVPDPPVIGDSVTFNIAGNAGDRQRRTQGWRWRDDAICTGMHA